MEEPRLAIRFQLPSQVGDEHLDRVRHREWVITPDLIEQALTRDDDPLVAHQVFEQLELALGELEQAIAAPDFVGVRVEGEIAERKSRLPARRTPPQERPKPSEELLAFERLDEVVVRARVEPLDP